MTEINPLKPCILCVEPDNEDGTVDFSTANVVCHKVIDDAITAAVDSVADRGGRRFLFLLTPIKMIEQSKPRVVDIGS